MRDIKESICKRISLEPKYQGHEDLNKLSNECIGIITPLLVNDINKELIEKYEKENINNIIAENKLQADRFETFSRYERKFLSFNQFVIDYVFMDVFYFIILYYIRKFKLKNQKIKKILQKY